MILIEPRRAMKLLSAIIFAALLACLAGLTPAAAAPLTLPLKVADWRPLSQRQDQRLQARLAHALEQHPAWQALIREEKMAVGLVDLSDPKNPRLCPGERQYHDVCRQSPQDRGAPGGLGEF